MASTENGSPISSEEDVKYGFQRPEMYSSNLANTVDFYDRHVFLCYKGPEAWAPKVEDSDTDLLPKLLSSAVKARKDDITVKTKLTICGGCDGTKCSDGDVLVFPEMIKYKGLTEADVDQFVDDVFVNGKPWASGEREALKGSYIFVCAHGSRDKRCGVCGPELIEKLKEGIEARGMVDQVFVSPCSHIGGHKYAGNLIVYSPDAAGKISGHWYGYVTPDDVDEVLDQQIINGQVVDRLWRGQMGGVAPVEKEKAREQKISNGEEQKISNGEEQKISNGEEQKISNGEEQKKIPNGEETNEKQHQEAPTVTEEKESVNSGCCQGTTGVSCCREVILEDKLEKPEETSPEEESTRKGSICKLSCWVGKWDQRELLTAAAVVGAVATVAVAYSVYKRSHH